MMSFEQFALMHGVDASRVVAGSGIQRVPTTTKPRSKNGAVFFDGQRGWVQNWEVGFDIHWFDDPAAKGWSDEERRAWIERKRILTAEQERAYANAARRAQAALSTTRMGEHGYLMFKGLKECRGLVLPDGGLFIPMRNVVTNELRGAQSIRWDEETRKWVKKMLHGMKAKNAVFRLGPKTASETILCEGYATGLSIELAVRLLRLNAAVMVCFSAGNLVNVAPQIKGRKFVFADNDESQAGENAAKKTGLPYCMADTVGFDANDLHVRDGLYELADMVMRARTLEVAA